MEKASSVRVEIVAKMSLKVSDKEMFNCVEMSITVRWLHSRTILLK